jgi:DNA-binding transcriptional LysR family regulator
MMERARLRRYLRHGTLPQLVAFEATARLGSCSRAAEVLHQSQPTISIHIKKLSESLGQPLFERAGRGMRLTPAGEEVYQTCHVLFSTFEELDERLARQSEDQGAEARIAVTQ